MEALIKNGAEKLGIKLTDYQIGQLIKYSELLTEENKKINLTAITEPGEIVTKHFLDSLTALKTDRVSGRVIDVGTGAGFPGLVLKIAVPEIKLTLLDSLQKRVNFLKIVTEELSLGGVELIHARAEDAGQNAAMRGKFDTAVSRAVANMTVLSEWCLPFLKKGGCFLALKGPQAEAELDGARRAVNILGGEAEDIFEAEIPFTDLKHKIIIIKKVRQTPIKYPRKPGIAAKNPIEQCYNLRK